MEVQHLAKLLSELTPNSECKYVRSEEVCVFVKIDTSKIRLYTKTPDGNEFEFAPTFIQALAEGIKENKPFNTSQILNNKGSNRAVIDSIIAHTSEFYWLQDGRSRFLVWVPAKPHKVGELVEWTDVDSLAKLNKVMTSSNTNSVSRQIIYYGAPGTGKSHEVAKTTKQVEAETKANHEEERVFRTTFHPDSDYSTFVGCYKPTMQPEPQTYVVEGQEKPVVDKDGKQVMKEKIVYNYIPQAFTNAYVRAWQTDKDVYLVIEEINRGNCAQIFGDLFQLLDRDKDGYSKYPIDSDSDLGNHICKALLASERNDIPEEVKSGKKMQLPSNLYIWATMNTSDQSLFPIDSAFKRRWDWKYMKIKNHPECNYKIKMGEEEQDWWAFIQKINEIIASMTSSADKQLGYFFCCAKNRVIDEETFVSKVIFYLWNDVFKDYGFEDASLFRYKVINKGTGKEEEKDLTFPDFYDEDGEKVNTERLTDFVKKVMNWKADEKKDYD